MKQVLSRLLAPIFFAILAAPFVVPFEQWLVALGWGSPVWLTSTSGWLRRMYEHPLSLILLGGALGFAVGFWLDGWAQRFDGRNPITRAGKLKKLAPDLSIMAHEIDDALHMSFRTRDLGPMVGRLNLLLIELSESGITLPKSSEGVRSEVYLRYVAAVFHRIYPLLKAGRIAHAENLVFSSAAWRLESDEEKSDDFRG